MRYFFHIAVIYLFTAFATHGQGEDTTLLDFNSFLNRVKEHHPVAVQANLQLEKGNASVMQARGGFDPKAFTEVNQKYYSDNKYYSLIDGGLKIPTWFGLEVKGGYEQNEGLYLNPENNVPAAGLWYAGLSLPLGQGLFIDQRRAELRQAQVYQQSTEVERVALLNEVLYEAGKAYWAWFEAYNKVRIYEEAVALANQRFEAVRQGSFLGDRPAIDTLEAGIQWQNRQLNLQEAQLSFNNASAMLSVFLWEDGIIPLEVAPGTLPPSSQQISYTAVSPQLLGELDSLINNHPNLRQYAFKLDQMEIERRWKKEQLKPTLNLNYNAITEATPGNPLAEYSINNYKWGLSFNMPLFLRKERGSLNMANLKIRETELEYSNKSAALNYKAVAALNEWDNTAGQVQLYTKTVRDYRGLLNGERQMFSAGESSLFMVNSRELGYINAQLKLVELLTKNQKASLESRYALGILNN